MGTRPQEVCVWGLRKSQSFWGDELVEEWWERSGGWVGTPWPGQAKRRMWGWGPLIVASTRESGPRGERERERWGGFSFFWFIWNRCRDQIWVEGLEFSQCFLCVQANLIDRLVRQNPSFSLSLSPSLSFSLFLSLLGLLYISGPVVLLPHFAWLPKPSLCLRFALSLSLSALLSLFLFPYYCITRTDTHLYISIRKSSSFKLRRCSIDCMDGSCKWTTTGSMTGLSSKSHACESLCLFLFSWMAFYLTD